jgi:F0F1-type ATP synthase delta subunit
MKTPRRKIAALLAERSLAPGADAKALSRTIAAYLLQYNRTGELGSLLRDVQQIRAERGIVEVIARTAHELTSATKKDIDAYVKDVYPEAKQIIISEVRDADIVGGVRLEFANQQLDLSVRGKLNRFKQLTTVEN